MKASEIEGIDIAEWLRLDEDDINVSELERLRDTAIAYIAKYTSQTREYLDEQPDICHAVLVLVQDMHDNRAFCVESDKVNVVVQSILDLHRKLIL